MLARSVARSTGCTFKRIQFTPDILPSDVTGVSIYNQKTGDFEFRAGPILSQVVLADEINRASPKTQSALLEAMEERQVTVDGVTRQVPLPPGHGHRTRSNTRTFPLQKLNSTAFSTAHWLSAHNDRVSIVSSSSAHRLRPSAGNRRRRDHRRPRGCEGYHVDSLVKRYIVALAESTTSTKPCTSAPRRAVARPLPGRPGAPSSTDDPFSPARENAYAAQGTHLLNAAARRHNDVGRRQRMPDQCPFRRALTAPRADPRVDQ
jgi:hypothetical protein